MLGYLDPGSASVAVSVVAGGVAGAVVAVKGSLGRFRRKGTAPTPAADAASDDDTSSDEVAESAADTDA